jgi:hypothetical protein
MQMSVAEGAATLGIDESKIGIMRDGKLVTH